MIKGALMDKCGNHCHKTTHMEKTSIDDDYRKM
jgi:hypothetical protein